MSLSHPGRQDHTSGVKPPRQAHRPEDDGGSAHPGATTATQPGPRPSMNGAAAFFDLDNTLVKGSSALHFGRGLAARGYFTYRDVCGFLYAQAKTRLLGRENARDDAAVRR